MLGCIAHTINSRYHSNPCTNYSYPSIVSVLGNDLTSFRIPLLELLVLQKIVIKFYNNTRWYAQLFT